LSGRGFLIGAHIRRVVAFVVFSKKCAICISRKRKGKGAGANQGEGITTKAPENANTRTTEDADITTTGGMGAGIIDSAPEDAFITAAPLLGAGIAAAASAHAGITVDDLIKDHTNDTMDNDGTNFCITTSLITRVNIATGIQLVGNHFLWVKFIEELDLSCPFKRSFT